MGVLYYINNPTNSGSFTTVEIEDANTYLNNLRETIQTPTLTLTLFLWVVFLLSRQKDAGSWVVFIYI
jgi:hypothetical protein